MKIEVTTTQKILTSDNNKWLFNGVTYGKTVIMPLDCDETVWYEIDEEKLPREEDIIL